MVKTIGRITHGVSFELAVLPAAKKRAADRRQSLSAYVCQLISNDLGCELYATKPQKQTIIQEDERDAA